MAPVFISYARETSSLQAAALAARLGELAFFDTEIIEAGAVFPDTSNEDSAGWRCA
jgi:hypothetical protein